MSGMTFTLAMTSPALTYCPASFVISVMMPEIWGFTFTSLRGSILPVMMVVFFTPFISGVNSWYTMSSGSDFCQRNTNVPMNTSAIMAATISLLYFFIFLLFFSMFRYFDVSMFRLL